MCAAQSRLGFGVGAVVGGERRRRLLPFVRLRYDRLSSPPIALSRLPIHPSIIGRPSIDRPSIVHAFLDFSTSSFSSLQSFFVPLRSQPYRPLRILALPSSSYCRPSCPSSSCPCPWPRRSSFVLSHNPSSLIRCPSAPAPPLFVSPYTCPPSPSLK